MSSNTLVEVEELTKYFYEQDSLLDRLLGDDPVAIRAVDGLDLTIREGETLGLVGESGCGKSTAGETILRLQEPTEGTVRYNGTNIFEADAKALREFRRESAIVFQDPFSSLNPRMTIGQSIREPLDIHGVGDRSDRRARVEDLLEEVGLSADLYDRYPQEFSGGQRQRIGIARALALEPSFIVLDEPTSALDVSVQAQILNLVSELQDDYDLTYLLISHDLSVIRHVCDRVAVMYLGEIVEVAPVDELFEDPSHPYTEALLESVPRADITERDREVEPLVGSVPSPRNPPSGCRFRTRCPKVIQPDGLELDQATYRSLMTLRQHVERRSLPVQSVWADLETEPPAEDEPVPEAFVASMLEATVDASLPLSHRQTLEEAFTLIARDQWERAETVLAERYESVCERESPPLESDGTALAACHLDD